MLPPIPTESIISLLAPYESRPWLLGFSGGCDSMVLCDLLSELFPHKKKIILHANHQLQTEAQQWENFAAETATKYGDVVISAKICLKNRSEAQARQQRYDFFYQTALSYQDPILLLAHHRDDLDETALWRFLRGTPLLGLAGMRQISYFRDIIVVRPLLEVTRGQIEEYAYHKKLLWVQDPSNHDSRYTRNFLRHEIFPALRDKNLSSVSVSCARLNDDAQALLAHQRHFLQNPKQLELSSYPLKEQGHHRSLLQNWLATYQQEQPSYRALSHFISQCHQSPQKTPLLQLPSGEILAFYRGTIFKQSPLWWELPHPQRQAFVASAGVWGVWSYQGLKQEAVFRRLSKNEKIPQQQRAQQYWVTKFLPPWQRPFYPLIECDGHMLQYGTLWHLEGFEPLSLQLTI